MVLDAAARHSGVALADFGAACAGALVTPIYHTNSPEECAHVLAHSGSRLVICENNAQAAKVEQIRARCPALEAVVLFGGAAGDSITLEELRRRGLGVRPEIVLEAYGLTETCGAATINTVEALRFGTVGKRLPGTELQIARDGEILLRGAHVFKGYYQDPVATARAITAGGWLHKVKRSAVYERYAGLFAGLHRDLGW